MKNVENSNDVSSLAYLMDQIFGPGKYDSDYIGRNAEILGISPSYFERILKGVFIPALRSLKTWPDKLRPHYDLDRICEETNLTLQEMFDLKIAQLEQVSHRSTLINDDYVLLLWEIIGTRRNYQKVLSEVTGISLGNIKGLINMPEIYGHDLDKGLTDKFVTKLFEAFPEKRAEIQRLRIHLQVGEGQLSAAAIKSSAKNMQIDFRQAAGILIREIREKFDDKIEDIENQFKTPVLKGKLLRIEENDKNLASSIYRDAVREICDIYRSREPEISARYINILEQIRERIRPR